VSLFTRGSGSNTNITIMVVGMVLGFVICLDACARPRESHPPHASAPQADAGVSSGDTLPTPADRVPSLDNLAGRGATDAPQMREVLRVADASAKTAVKAIVSDACVRAIVASSAPMRAWFEDDAHAPRGDIAVSASASSTSLVPPRGPACVRKGETLHLVVEASIPHATSRAVVWQAP
jgi:hypothetical protein